VGLPPHSRRAASTMRTAAIVVPGFTPARRHEHAAVDDDVSNPSGGSPIETDRLLPSYNSAHIRRIRRAHTLGLTTSGQAETGYLPS